jgi:hypothetical protein
MERLNIIYYFDLFDKYGLYNCKIELIRYVNYTTRSELKAKCIEDINRCDMCINNIQQHSMFKDSIIKQAITNKCEYFKICSDSEERRLNRFIICFNNIN